MTCKHNGANDTRLTVDIASDSRESNTTVVNLDSGGLRRGSATFIAREHDLHKYRRQFV